MKRTTAPGSAAGAYVDDNPALGVVGTLLIAEDRNAIQEEIVNAIEAAGLTPASANLEQLKSAIEILAWAKVLASDGTGSTLDADTVDGIQAERMIYGSDSTGATSVTDANTATKSGFYELATPFTNGPTAAEHIILTMRIVSSTRVFQIAVATGGNSTFVRNYNGSAWSAWAKLWNADNDGSGSGLDADLLDGANLAETGVSTVVKRDATGRISSGGIKPVASLIGLDKTENEVFDFLSPYVPNTNDEILLHGVGTFGAFDKLYVFVSAKRKDATNITITMGWKADSAEGIDQDDCTDGGTSTYMKAIALYV